MPHMYTLRLTGVIRFVQETYSMPSGSSDLVSYAARESSTSNVGRVWRP
jgi:hypothetical protein